MSETEEMEFENEKNKAENEQFSLGENILAMMSYSKVDEKALLEERNEKIFSGKRESKAHLNTATESYVCLNRSMSLSGSSEDY